MAPSSIIALRRQSWQDYVERFDAMYSPAFAEVYEGEPYEGHKIFAWHAAFAVFFTPDLLYQLWINFRVYPATRSERMLNIPNFVVSDFLLSGVCTEVSPRLYALPFALREQLLGDLRADARFGARRLRQLAHFLDHYHREAQTTAVERGVATYHDWLARTLLDPDGLQEELRNKLQQSVDQQQLLELRRLNRVLADFKQVNARFQPLADYSQLMDRYLIARSPEAGAGMMLETVEMGPIKVPFYQELEKSLTLDAGADAERRNFVPGQNKLYALIVGIDRYQAAPDLQGAVNDAKALEAFLQARTYPGGIDCRTLYNEEATREGIIQAFFTHLSQAGPGDVALFYYSGHGSQEQAHPVFYDIEQDGLFETLVCHDSRADARDLLDIELNALLHLIDKQKPFITTILNGCMVGEDDANVSRPSTSQVVSEVRPVEPLDGKAEGYDDRQQPFVFYRREFRSSTDFGERMQEALNRQAGRVRFPLPTQWQIASTLSHEMDYERSFEGQVRSLFSYALMDVLESSRFAYSYQELVLRLNNRMRSLGLQQTPHVVQTGEAELSAPFLHGALAPVADQFPVYWRGDNQQWVIDAGKAHGLPPVRSQERSTLAIFEEAKLEADLLDQGSPLAEATVEAVFAQQSVLGGESLSSLNKQQVYQAVIRNLPIEKTRVLVELSPSQQQGARRQQQRSPLTAEQITQSLRQHPMAVYYELVQDLKKAEYVVTSRNDQLRVSKDSTVVIPGTEVVLLPNQLAALSRYDRIRELHNPLSHLRPGMVGMTVVAVEGDGPMAQLEGQRDGSVLLTCAPDQEAVPPVGVRISVSAPEGDAEAEPCYIALLLLKPDHAIKATDAVAFQPGESRTITIEQEFELPPRGGGLGLSWRANDLPFTLKLILSRSPFDASSLEQQGLDDTIPEINQKASNSLEALFFRAQTRKAAIDTEASLTDWTTQELWLTVRRAEPPEAEASEAGAFEPEGPAHETPAHETPERALALIMEEREARTGRLHLGGCGLTSWPPELFELDHLEVLILSNALWNREEKQWEHPEREGTPNRLTHIPPEIKQLSDLRELFLNGDQEEDVYLDIQDLSALAELPSLRKLELAYTRVQDLRPLSGLLRLQELNLSYTYVEDIAPLADMPDLQVLNLFRCNQVKDFSPLATLSQLTHLYLSRSNLSDLAPLGNMLQLHTLYLRKTPIQDLRPLMFLRNLRKLDVSGTQVSELRPLLPHVRRGLPVLLERDTSQDAILVYDCPLTNPPKGVIRKGPEALLAYLEAAPGDFYDALIARIEQAWEVPLSSLMEEVKACIQSVPQSSLAGYLDALQDLVAKLGKRRAEDPANKELQEEERSVRDSLVELLQRHMAERQTPPAFQFFTEAEVKALVEQAAQSEASDFNADFSEDFGSGSTDRPESAVLEALLIYQTSTQQTWLVTTRTHLYCILDDEETRREASAIQWHMPLEEAQPIATGRAYQYENSGLLHIGKRRNWLYSMRLFSDPLAIISRVRQLVEDASAARTAPEAAASAASASDQPETPDSSAPASFDLAFLARLMRRHTKRRLNWPLTQPLEVGDIGVLDEAGQFTRTTRLSELGVDLELRELPMGLMAYSEYVKALRYPDSRRFQFDRADGFVFEARQVRSLAIRDLESLSRKVLALAQGDPWSQDWCLITEVVEAGQVFLAVGGQTGAALEVSRPLELLKLEQEPMRVMKQQNMAVVDILEGCTPLFRVMGVVESRGEARLEEI